jgi:hypothetical protein
MNHSLARFCPSKVSAQRFRVRNPTPTTKQSIFGVGFILFVILLARAALIDPIIGITWVIFLVSIVIFHYIRKLTSKLIMRHYDIYTVMAEIEERDKAIPAHVFATPTRASAAFLQLFYENRAKLKLTTGYNIDPVALQKIGEDEGFIIDRPDAEQLAKSLMKKYPNLVMEIRMRAEKPAPLRVRLGRLKS